MSWERLGVPPEAARYVVSLDRCCFTVPFTPHAKYVFQKWGLRAFSLNPTTDSTAQGFLGATGCFQVLKKRNLLIHKDYYKKLAC